MKTFPTVAARTEHNRINTCFESIDQTPVTLPAVGTKGDYVMPAIITSDGVVHAPGFRVACTVSLHIGKFGLQLTEDARPRFAIECHFSSFEPATPATA